MRKEKERTDTGHRCSSGYTTQNELQHKSEDKEKTDEKHRQQYEH